MAGLGRIVQDSRLIGVRMALVKNSIAVRYELRCCGRMVWRLTGCASRGKLIHILPIFEATEPLAKFHLPI